MGISVQHCKLHWSCDEAFDDDLQMKLEAPNCRLRAWLRWKAKKNQQQNPTQARQKNSQPHTATFHTSNSGAQCNGRHRLWDMRHLSGHLPGPITRECVPRRNRWGRVDGRVTKQPLQVEGRGALVLSGRTNRVYC